MIKTITVIVAVVVICGLAGLAEASSKPLDLQQALDSGGLTLDPNCGVLKTETGTFKW